MSVIEIFRQLTLEPCSYNSAAMNLSSWRANHAWLLCAALVLIVWSLSSSADAQAPPPEQPKPLQQIMASSQTAMSAMKVGQWVRLQDWSFPLPRTSQDLTIEARSDAWGKPFCIIQIGARVAVVSGGPSRFSCDALPLSAKQIVESKRDYFITPEKLVVIIVARAGPPWAR